MARFSGLIPAGKLQSKACPCADPPAGPEGDELEVLPLDVDALVSAAGEEPGRAELQRLRPRRRVVGDRPDVDQQRGALGNGVAGDLARLGRHAGEGERRGGIGRPPSRARSGLA